MSEIVFICSVYIPIYAYFLTISMSMKAVIHLHGVHERLVEGVVKVRDDRAEWVDLKIVNYLKGNKST